MNTKHFLLTIACASLYATTTLAEKNELMFSDWDSDGNKSVSLAEWDATIEEKEIFENLDDNNNGMFDIDEAVDSIFDYDISMDLDAGGHIERQEFTVATFNNLDKNNDDKLDNAELRQFNDKLTDSDLLTSS